MAKRKPRGARESGQPLYTVELDLRITFDPLMDDDAPPVVLTRTIQLPFAPVDGIRVYSRDWDGCPEPLGFALKEVVWDVDRQVFLAHTCLGVVDAAVAEMPRDILDHVERGWRLGSYMDQYASDEGNPPPPGGHADVPEDPFADLDEADLYAMHTRPPKQRPAEFNELFDAMVRLLASGHGNAARTAYAMNKTGVYLGPQPEKYDDAPRAKIDPAAQREWDERCREYDRMDFDARYDWQQGLDRLPEVADVVMKPRRRAIAGRR